MKLALRISAAFLFALADADLSFVACGDWGGNSAEEPTTHAQRKTAIGMMRTVRNIDANFSVMLGDNIYQNGVKAEGDMNRFVETFEKVYPPLLDEEKRTNFDFYVMAGNHDYGHGEMANISMQVDYSKHSSNWRYPSLWYSIDREFEAEGRKRTLQILVLDTIVLCGDGQKNEHIIDEQLRHIDGGSFAEPGQRRQAVAERHWAWLEAELKSSTADYLWAAGHFALSSIGKHGSSECLVDRLQPLLRAHGAHYMSGHDHMLQHFEVDGVHSLVSGAGMECCSDPESINSSAIQALPADAMQYALAGEHGHSTYGRARHDILPEKRVLGGFASFHFGAESSTVSLHDHDGTVLHRTQEIPRRLSRASLSDEVDILEELGSSVPWLLTMAQTHTAKVVFASLLGTALAFSAVVVWSRRSSSVSQVDCTPLLA